MGSICTNNYQKQEGTETVDTHKNSVQLQVSMGEACSVNLILGHYRQHRSDSLFVITEFKNIQHCDPIRDYTNDADKIIQIITNMRKTFYKAVVTKSCPYKKLLLCVLPQYKSEDSHEYQQQFKNVLREVFQNTKEATLELINTIEGIHSLPNQLILTVLLQELMQLKTPFKLHLITTEKKMMNLYKYELLKTEALNDTKILQIKFMYFDAAFLLYINFNACGWMWAINKTSESNNHFQQ